MLLLVAAMQAILGLQRLKLSSPILKSIVTRYASKASVVKKRRTILVSIKGEILYGSHPVLLALEASKRTFHCVYYLPTSSRIHEIIDICNSRGIDTREVKRTLLNQLTRVEGSEGPHKGVCADVEPLVPKADDWIVDEELVDPGKDRLWLLLCSIGDPYNLGAIIRTAYFLGVEKVLTCSPWDCPQAMAPLTPIASRASAGAIEVFTPTTIRQPEIFLQKLKEKGELDKRNQNGETSAVLLDSK